MNQNASNPCVRCGKQRVDNGTHEKVVETFFGKTVVTITDTVCPDSACQEIVVAEIESKRQKKEALEQERVERLERMRAKRVQGRT